MGEEYEYGQPIPEKYRDRLYDWCGGGYSGCLWEMNFGVVDHDGHWRPIYSSGRDGLDQDEWYDRKIGEAKARLGWHVGSYGSGEPVAAQFERLLHAAVKKVQGCEWYLYHDDPMKNPEILKELGDAPKRKEEFERICDEYKLERQHRLDSMFMDVVSGRQERDEFQEVGRLDDEHIKETCRTFCASYHGNVGMIIQCMDGLRRLGYESWVTCTDCGEQFQPGDYEDFESSIDRDAYTGDGGIGIILKRVLCDECRMDVECPHCCAPSRPNSRIIDFEHLYDKVTGKERFLMEWYGVCEYCADSYLHDNKEEAEKIEELCAMLDDHYNQVAKYLAHMKDVNGCSEEELDKLASKQDAGWAKERAKAINELRDELQESCDKYFTNANDWGGNRL